MYSVCFIESGCCFEVCFSFDEYLRMHQHVDLYAFQDFEPILTQVNEIYQNFPVLPT